MRFYTRFVKPTIHILADTKINTGGFKSFLEKKGVSEWVTDAKSDSEKIIEVAGKLCYNSYDVKHNKNLTKVRNNDNKGYITKSIIGNNHGSVLEHGSVTIAFCNVSRVFTHELVRHRAGCAYSQESGRFIRREDILLVDPGFTDEEKKKLSIAMIPLSEAYKSLLKSSFSDKQGMKEKKTITSAVRRVLPEGGVTSIIMTANHRALRHIINLRTANGAEIEIKSVFNKLCKILIKRYPNIYADFKDE